MKKIHIPTTSAFHMHGLVRALWQSEKLSLEQAEDIEKKVRANKTLLIDTILQNSTIDSHNLASFCSTLYGYPMVDLSLFDQKLFPEKIISAKIVQTQQVLVVAKNGNTISIATSDPSDTHTMEQIKFQTGFVVEPLVVEHYGLIKLLEKNHKKTEYFFNHLADFELDASLNKDFLDTTDAEIDDAPIVKFLQKILIDGISSGASDIHFEPFEKSYRIRFRIDGILQELVHPPLAIKDKLAARIKVISKLDISEKRVPQDGRFKIAFDKTRSVDFRVSTLPTLFGEKIVMRILDANQTALSIDALGYDATQKEILLNAIHRPYGMILVTGPTGSGKTVSLYTYLNIINQPGVNISTAEDPAEINLAGINQVNVNEKAGVTFAVVLKALLRQDPDVIMVGEIRDIETSNIAIKAAQTGHLVFATLHTNDAPATLTRLINMGVEPFNIASSVTLITAQRLARRLCSCKQPTVIERNVLVDAGFTEENLREKWQAYKAVGCEVCKNTGYKGRIGIHQVMPISPAIEKIILSNGTTVDIEHQANKEGVKSLRQSGLIKVMQGITTLEEIISCTNS